MDKSQKPSSSGTLTLIDTHCHLHDKEFFAAKQAEEMLKRAHEAGVEKIICIGTSHEDSLVARDFANTHGNVYWTYGLHPECCSRQSEYDFLRDGSLAPVDPSGRPRPKGRSVTGLAPSSSVVTSGSPQKVYSELPTTNDEKPYVNRPLAIGEVGLDYHYEGYNREAQIKLFEQMLQLAVDNNLPVSFHVREAFADFFVVVSNFPTVRGVVHSFTDSKKVLKKILNETDFYVGVNGLATYSTLPTPPLDRILLETDAPFLAPVPHRGETNEPAYIREIANWLSGKLGQDFETVAEVTTKNAHELFGL